MRTNELTDALALVAARVFEDAAFVFTDRPAEGDLPAEGMWEAGGAAVSFTGTPSGTLHLWAADGFARAAAANMLGLDEAAGPVDSGADALRELLNIIAGNLLTELYGTEPLFNLGIPQALAARELAADMRHENAVWLAAEGSAVLLTLRIGA